MENEYDLLNNVSVDFSKYKIEDVNEFEKKKMIKKFRKTKNKDIILNKKKVIVAASVALLLVINWGGYGEKALAFANELKYGINEWLGVTKQEYSKQIGETLNVNDTILTVKEFFMDGSRVVINVNSNKNYNNFGDLDDLHDMVEELIPEIYIDGEMCERASDYLGYRIGEYDQDNNNGDVIIEFYCNNSSLNDNNKIELVFSALAKATNASTSEFTYSFEYDATIYRNDSKVINVDKSIVIENSKLYIENITIIPDRVSILGDAEGFCAWYSDESDYYYDIVDENGNIIPLKEEIGEGAYFYRSNELNDLKTLIIVPYTFNKIDTSSTSITEEGRIKYIIEDKIIEINLE